MAAEQQIKRATPRKGEPKYDQSKSVEDNVYAMRNAGLTWPRVEALCGLKPYGRAQTAYRKACKERGQEPKDFRRKENRAPVKKAAKPAAKKATKKATPKKKAAAKPAEKKAEVDS